MVGGRNAKIKLSGLLSTFVDALSMLCRWGIGGYFAVFECTKAPGLESPDALLGLIPKDYLS